MKDRYADLGALVEAGLSLRQIAEEIGVSQHSVRIALFKRGLSANSKTKETHRQKVQEMRPIEAVEYLLEVIEGLFPTEDQHHPVDDLAADLTPKERCLMMVLWNASGNPVSVDQIMNALYADETDAPYSAVVNVFICKIRKKTAGKAEIRNRFGVGYSLHLTERQPA